jgi:hypothetical protein
MSCLSSIISGIIALGANGGEELFLPKIHSVLCQMKPHNRVLAGIWFSITGNIGNSWQPPGSSTRAWGGLRSVRRRSARKVPG